MAAKTETSQRIAVRNPATGELIQEIDAISPEAVEGLVKRARAAQPVWEAFGYEGRARTLLKAQRWVIDNAERVVQAVVRETGKAYEDAYFAELTYVANALGYWAKQAPKLLADERVSSSLLFTKGKRMMVRYRPVGVVGVIGPWNYPLTNSFGDCIPALAAGNAVVLKPSEVTPLVSQLMVEMALECGIPEDVFQTAIGDGSVGAALIDHVDFVMFTGSTATGKKVMKRAAKSLTPVSLELGGKDPMIVLADANLERAANAAVHGAMSNGGQICISVERLYVEDAVYDEFVFKVVDRVRKLRQGVPQGPGSIDVGAVIFPPQLEIIKRHVADAVSKGARVLTGGKAIEDGGRFFQPTVITGVNHQMDCMVEETFGPTLPIMRVKDAEEAVALANDSEYGLQASVWTKDTDRGEAIANRIEAGVVTVNDIQVNYAALELPMGGWKNSGLGSRHGAMGIRKYTRQQTLLVAKFAPKRDLYMQPYRASSTAAVKRIVKLLYGRGKRD